MKLRQQFHYGYRCGDTSIRGKIPLLHGGVVDDDNLAIPGVRDVTKLGTGKYRIDLNERFLGLTAFQANIQNAATDGYDVILLNDEFIDGDEGVNAAVNQRDGYCEIQVIQADGTGAVNLTNGTAIWFTLGVKTSEQG
jgi:hypothetical protein